MTSERQRELAHRISAAEGLVQLVLEADVGRGEFVDDTRIEVAAPEVREPASADRLVVLDRHACTSLVGIGLSGVRARRAACRRAPTSAGCMSTAVARQSG